MDNDYDTLIDMMTTLFKDVNRCYEDLKMAENSAADEDQHFRRRAYTRAVFAAIEGSCEYFRTQAFLAQCNQAPRLADIGKLSVLAGEKYYVTDDGDIRVEKIRLAFLNHVLLSLKSYAAALGVVHPVQKADQWYRFKRSVTVRDRITHPKTLSGLAITKEEIADMECFLAWFLNEIGFIFREKGYEVPSVLSKKPGT